MLSQDDYKLYTGETSGLSDEDWTKIVSMAAVRLAGLLCLKELPSPLSGNLAMLLANFICMMLNERGDKSPVTSKKIRNFTINYGTNTASIFAKLKRKYPDIIADYSKCGNGFAVEKSTRCCCGRF